MEKALRGGEWQITGDIRATGLYSPSKGDASALSESDLRRLRDLYDAEIRYVDQSLGEFFAFLKARGSFESSLIIVTSDHGESLGEHGNWTHGRSLYDPEVHVPMLVKLPHQKKGGRVARPVQLIDVYPTVSSALSLQHPKGIEGRSLLVEHDEPALIIWLKQKVVRTPDWKLLEIGDRTRLFQIQKDPAEEHDLSSQHPKVVRRLQGLREKRLAEIERSESEIRELTNEAVEQMRALGYIE
jgi:arylsulfatase A-like enzyme